MSMRYKGSVISATPPTLATNAGASGAWTLEQQMQATAAGLWPANGPFFVEDVFSTWLYTGNGSTQTINNGIDLAGKGGLVWRKLRSAAGDHILEDTVRGAGNYVISNATNAQANSSTLITSFNTTGFTTGAGSNTNGSTYASWTFRKQPKFFDVVTYTGNGTSSNAISHNLQSVPGCIIVKATSTTGDWWTFVDNANSPGNYFILKLNTTAAANGPAGGTNITSSSFNAADMSYQAATNYTTLNASGVTYVAYLFANNAGGFGLSGTDNVITCGRFTTDGSGNATVNLGYETQWTTVKASSTTGNWITVDSMRGTPVGSTDQQLYPNLSNAETSGATIDPTATGFNATGLSASQTFVYIAIRRGPMRTPTSGTQVFAPRTYTGVSGGATATITAGFPIDMVLARTRNNSDIGSGNSSNALMTRLTRISTTNNYAAATSALFTPGTDAEITTLNGVGNFNNTGFTVDGNSGGLSSPSGEPFIAECFRRAPGFFDVVCYTGTGVARTVAHSLTVPPELIIVKARDTSLYDWPVYAAPQGNTQRGFLNLTNVFATGSVSLWDNTSPTSSVFTVSGAGTVNASGTTYVAYLFASCPGVSKVGSYTGNGSSQVINCGFTGGARFVLIKQTTISNNEWFVWDSARGIVPGNDPFLTLNRTWAEDSSTDSVDTDSSGFVVNQNGTTSINSSGAEYIFLAIA